MLAWNPADGKQKIPLALANCYHCSWDHLERPRAITDTVPGAIQHWQTCTFEFQLELFKFQFFPSKFQLAVPMHGTKQW